MTSDVPDHCRKYALSDPGTKVYQSACDHSHDSHCARCELLAATIQEMEESLEKISRTQDEV